MEESPTECEPKAHQKDRKARKAQRKEKRNKNQDLRLG